MIKWLRLKEMEDLFEKVFIVSRVDKQEAKQVLTLAINLLKNKTTELYVVSDAAGLVEKPELSRPLNEVRSIKPSLLVSIGGDGTILWLHNRIQEETPPILPVKVGTFGFLSEITPDQLGRAIAKIEKNSFYIERRAKLKLKVNKIEKDFLNEATIITKTCKCSNLQISIEKEKLIQGLMDGCLVSTPTGSLAYNLSAGGPVVDPETEVSIVTLLNPWPFASFTPIKRIVVPMNKRISVTNIDKKEVAVFADGEKVTEIKKLEKVEVEKSPKKISFVRFDKNFFYKRFRNWRKKIPKRFMF